LLRKISTQRHKGKIEIIIQNLFELARFFDFNIDTFWYIFYLCAFG